MSLVPQASRNQTDPGTLAVLPFRNEFKKLTDRKTADDSLVERLTWLFGI